MSREMKRVPTDFNWPLNTIWHGYRIVHCIDDHCDDCKLFAKIKGMKFESYGCPKFSQLDPPAGDGYQMWETTSEGSPISPVFGTPEDLATWLADNGASSFGSSTATYEQWLGMIKGPGWAPSAVVDSKGLRSGVEAVSDISK